ncbi:MAG TPA: OB-fold nucleic acid binding domain-containing protein [Thermoanaerobaculia bacterium]|nr:OB-fold nucleic acid binding domain-containing protein [Thermoanaerobaculia bacterium]HUM28529.1 OB-fold nucleic acid binding domain-containing protein [Thermoanaerobaculia bacterium]HXK66863.1 OB-fold nucleic acid binding domain-containing protein [Thermoanaerobaculia bacterium]
MSTEVKDIAQLMEGQAVDLPLMVVQKEIRQSKTGSTFLQAIFRDASGSITAFMWDNFEPVASKLQPGQVVRIKGRTQKYRNSIQLVLHKIELMADEEVDQQAFMPSADANVNEMYADLMDMVSTVENSHILALLKAMLGNDEISKAFRNAPAAKTMHHSYIGGLLEHTLSLVKLCDHICMHYDHLNRDMLIAGACLHDIGKIRELSHDGWMDYSREGRLIGHITIGVQMIDQFSAEIEGFPMETKELLQHMILSHHGEYEYGSPRRPKTREALALHFLDNLDSHLNGFDQALKDQGSEVAYAKILERFIFDT